MELLPAPKSLASTDHLNEWLYEIIEPYLKGRVLEVDSGPDTLSSIFVQRDRGIHLNNRSKVVRNQLRIKYKGVETIRSINRADFSKVDFEEVYSEKYRIFDTIIALNVVDTGHYDQSIIHHAKHLLRERGRLIVLAPAYTALYHTVEQGQEIWKKYNRKYVRKLITNNMEMLMTRYFILEDPLVYHHSGLSVLAIARKTG